MKTSHNLSFAFALLFAAILGSLTQNVALVSAQDPTCAIFVSGGFSNYNTEVQISGSNAPLGSTINFNDCAWYTNQASARASSGGENWVLGRTTNENCETVWVGEDAPTVTLKWSGGSC